MVGLRPRQHILCIGYKVVNRFGLAVQNINYPYNLVDFWIFPTHTHTHTEHKQQASCSFEQFY